jgi:class 3 adenylate cyclase
MAEITRIHFEAKASKPRRGLAMIFDLEGFSKFFNQPDSSEYVALFLNHVFEAVNACIYGGENYWLTKHDKLPPLSIPPAHAKFMGDGGLYVWVVPRGHADFRPAFVANLCNRLWNLKTHFPKVVAKSYSNVPVADLPPRIRFGLGAGSIYQLSHASKPRKEFIGVSLNLASRLQTYCPDLGFIASARLGLDDAMLSEYGYVKVIATQLKGFSNEIVFVDNKELVRLKPDTRAALFKDLPMATPPSALAAA